MTAIRDRTTLTVPLSRRCDCAASRRRDALPARWISASVLVVSGVLLGSPGVVLKPGWRLGAPPAEPCRAAGPGRSAMPTGSGSKRISLTRVSTVCAQAVYWQQARALVGATSPSLVHGGGGSPW